MATQLAPGSNPTDTESVLQSSSAGNQKPRVQQQEHDTVPVHDNHGSRFLPRFRVHTAGESGRTGIHPLRFLVICFKSTTRLSMMVNVLWPFVPAAFALHFARPDLQLWDFILSYIAMVPSANLLGFAGGELAKKLPKAFGIVLETALTSLVEIVMFTVLIVRDGHHNFIPVIQAAILGSILANLLLCLGLCFFVGGLRHHEQTFHEVISETGSSLLLVAGFGLLIPSTFYSALAGSTSTEGPFTGDVLLHNMRTISRATSILLMVSFFVWIIHSMHNHQSIYDNVLERDEEIDVDRANELGRAKLTFIECLIALTIALTCVSMSATFLVLGISAIVDRGVPDHFLGLILVPLVEKAAEHLTTIDEAWDNQINFALAHCLGPSVQTALFNGPLVVIIGWGLGKDMDLNFEIFMIVLLVLSTLVVGNFLRDNKSNYLEGFLLVLVYIIIAVTTWYYPNPHAGATNIQIPEGGHH